MTNATDAPARARKRCLDAAAALGRKDFAAARAAYVEAVGLGTDNPDAYNNLAVMALERHDLDEAIALFEAGLARVPGAVSLRGSLAKLLERRGQLRRRAGDYGAALTDFTRLFALQPAASETLCHTAITLMHLGRLEEALARANEAGALDPDASGPHAAAGMILAQAGLQAEAFAAFEQALARDPNNILALNNLALLASRLGRHGNAAALLVRAIERSPSAPLLVNLGNVLGTMGEIGEAVRAHRAGLALAPEEVAYRSGLLLAVNYDGSIAPEQVAAEHREFGARVHARFGPPRAVRPRDGRPERRLRVAYASPDLRKHSISYFLDPVLEAHDRGEVEVWAYALLPGEDAVTRRLRARCDEWRDAWGLSDEELVARIEADEVDVLIELSGHTAHNRLTAFARRAAPVQVTYLGYPNTTGLPAIDLRITDAIADPPGLADAWHSERLVRVEGGFLCYRPPADCPAVAALPSAAGAPFTFGSFNNLGKLGDGVLDAWARVLAAVPEASLFLKTQSLNDPRVRRRLLGAFERRGVGAERVRLLPHTPGTREHLDLYAQVDLALDSFPYNGTTTTCEALWMGVPVLALAGRSHPGRVGASLLQTVGLDRFVAADVDAYVEAAVAWTRRREELAALRQGLRARMSASPLMDARRLAGALERAYRAAWRERCLG